MKKAMMRCAGIDRASAVCDAAGVVQTEPDSMCEVFAKFYEDLYNESAKGQYGTSSLSALRTSIPTDEVIDGLKRLKNRKTGAEDGLVAEMLKTGHVGLIGAVAELFTCSGSA